MPKHFTFSDTNNVSEYNEFLRAFKDRPFVVLVYATWCGHCQHMREHWNAASKTASYDIVEIESSVYNAKSDENDSFVKAMSGHVSGYPTICKVENKKVEHFSGERNKNEFKKFMTRHGGPTALLKKYSAK